MRRRKRAGRSDLALSLADEVDGERKGPALVVGHGHGEMFLGSDAPAQMYEPMKGIQVTLGVDQPAEADRIFSALAENGSVRMPIQETFWAQRFGMLVDQFGTPWMINCERPGQ